MHACGVPASKVISAWVRSSPEAGSGAQEAAVDRDRLAGDARGGTGGEEERELGHVVCHREAAEREARQDLLTQLRRQVIAHHLGLEHRRRDGIHPDALWTQLAAEAPRRPRIAGTAACTQLKTPVRFTATSRSQASALVSSNGPVASSPALLTRTSMPPRSRTMRATASRRAARSVTSTRIPALISTL